MHVRANSPGSACRFIARPRPTDHQRSDVGPFASLTTSESGCSAPGHEMPRPPNGRALVSAKTTPMPWSFDEPDDHWGLDPLDACRARGPPFRVQTVGGRRCRAGSAVAGSGACRASGPSAAGGAAGRATVWPRKPGPVKTSSAVPHCGCRCDGRYEAGPMPRLWGRTCRPMPIARCCSFHAVAAVRRPADLLYAELLKSRGQVDSGRRRSSTSWCTRATGARR